MRKALRPAFTATIPVLCGYLFTQPGLQNIPIYNRKTERTKGKAIL